MIRDAVPGDAESIAGIYNHYVLNTTITFEEEAVGTNEMAGRIAEDQSGRLPWLVAQSDARVVGYASASKWKGRRGYRYSVESSVYVDPSAVGNRFGTQLYEQLFARLRACGLHAVIGGIALPNDASVALHEKFGMLKVAQFREVGFKFAKWIDVGYWQINL